MSVRLVFLGTGSGKPVPTRNVSCTALFREGELFLFDCGEGTQIQLAKSSVRPGAIAGIFLSHFHGDHVNGLPGLLGTLGLNQREEPLELVGPVGLKSWLRALRDTGILIPGFPLRVREIDAAGDVLTGDGWRITASPLDHRVPCFGYAFIEDARPGRFDLGAAKELGVPPGPMFGRLQRGEPVELEDGTVVTPDQVLGPARPGLKVVYACDTRPHDDVVEFARGADILIHESTFPAGDERKAHSRGHSTSGDAARCAKRAGVRQLILTHFSQTHPKLHDFLRPARKIFPRTEAAQDLWEFEVTRRES